jgi:uncharacterized Fe-S cluster-containing protein
MILHCDYCGFDREIVFSHELIDGIKHICKECYYKMHECYNQIIEDRKKELEEEE